MCEALSGHFSTLSKSHSNRAAPASEASARSRAAGATWSDWRAESRLTHGRRNRHGRSQLVSKPIGTRPPRASLSLSLSPPSAMLRSSLAKSLASATPRASRLAARPVLARAYHEKVISHYEQPRNVCLVRSGLPGYLITHHTPPPPCSPSALQVGSLPKNDKDVGTGLVGAPAYVPVLSAGTVGSTVLTVAARR